jgi:DUF1365 family protein
MIEKDEIITLEDNKEYYVVDTVELDEKYLYLINKDDKNDIILVKEVKENDESFIEEIEDEDKKAEVFKILYERL